VYDGAGLLSAANADGVSVPGSGTNSIVLAAPYADVAAVLASLRYAAPAAAGSDRISFDLWNQAGVETTGSIPVTIGTVTAPGPDTWTGAVSSDWNNGANWSTGAVPVSGDDVAIPGGTPFSPVLANATLAGEHIVLTTGGGQGGSVSFSDVTLGAGTSLVDVSSNTLPQPAITLGGTFTIASGATLAADAGALLVLHAADAAQPALVVNQGTIAGNGGHLSIDTGGTVENSGLVVGEASGSVNFNLVEFVGSSPPDTVVNSGTLLATGGGAIAVNGTVHGGSLRFDGSGGLTLQQPNALADGASIGGFGSGDTITLYEVAANGQSFGNGTLAVTNGGSVVEALPLQGSYTAANFAMAHQPGATFANVISFVPGTSPPPSGPQITAPASETVAAGGTLGIGGIRIADAYAASHPGSLALNVTDRSGTLRMTLGGSALPGSGTGAIHYSGTLAQINAALATLTYAAAAQGGSDSIGIDVWDQVGQEATTPIAVSVGGGSSGGGGTTGGGTTAGGADQTIVSTIDHDTIGTGAGNDTIFAGGSGDTIDAGGGNNVIQAYAGGSRIVSGSGDDTIRIGGTGNRVDAGGGANRIEDSGGGNTLVLPNAGTGSDDIYGYVLAANDLFDLRGALSNAGWSGDRATLGNFLGTAVANDGADTLVQIAPGGHGAGTTIATLHGNGAVSLTDLLAHAVLS
jgi:hypothetical protein